MLKIHSAKDVQEYRKIDALSQSLLKNLKGNIEKINRELDPNSFSIKVGSAVDMLLTSTKGDYEDNFYVMKTTLPSDTLTEIIKKVYEEILEDYNNYLEDSTKDVPETFYKYCGNLEEYEAYIILHCEKLNYNPRLKDPTKIKKVTEHSSYFKALIESKDKIILSSEEDTLIHQMVYNLKNSPKTKKYFDTEVLDSLPTFEIYYQLPIVFMYLGVKCKALLDMVFVELDEQGQAKTVTPVDLKTTGSFTFDFPSAVKSFRYDIQAYFYTKACEMYFPNAEILPFQFVVESTKAPGKPLVFEVTDEILTFALTGNDYVPGIPELMSRYQEYKKCGFHQELEITKAGNGPLKIGLHGVIIEENSN